MERSFTVQLRAKAASVAYSTAFALSTGSAPGSPRQTGQMFVLGAEPKWLAHPQKALVAVRSWTCTSSPMTGSYLARTSGESAVAAMISYDSIAGRGAADLLGFAERMRDLQSATRSLRRFFLCFHRV